jgi:hypothetical protein
MSVHTLEEELGFLQIFHNHVIHLIDTVKAWERLDAAAIEESNKNREPEVSYSLEAAKNIRQYTKSYEELRTLINLQLVRLRNIAKRYGLVFNEHWIYNLPTTRPRTAEGYTFTFDDYNENSIIRDILLIRGALNDNIREEKRRESRPRWLKVRDDYVFPVAKWLIKPEHSKFTLVAILVIVCAIVLHLFGFDAKRYR